MYGSIQRIHLVGIGGIGMSGIAEVLVNRGYTVSGSDLAESETTRHLRDLGVTVTVGHDADLVAGADIVVTSSAIPPDNPEVRAARANHVPLVRRAEMLAELMRTRYGIAIAGAHGKTTTTSLVGAALAATLDPTVVVGGRIESYGIGARLGAGEFLVAEADESDASFLMLSPSIVVVTNIDLEHVDHYGSLENILAAFRQFVAKVPFYGVAILCIDDPLVRQIAEGLERRTLTYGTSEDADLVVRDVTPSGLATSFRVNGLGSFTVNMPGRHNALNATAAIAVARELGVDLEGVRESLATFEGVGRRFNVKEASRGITLVDDYGHHPTEVDAVLRAARQVWPDRRILCLFQPHRYSRTQALWESFGASFGSVDEVWVLPVYAAGERPIPGVDAQLIVGAARKSGHRSAHLIDAEVTDVPDRLLPVLEDGDVVVTLGAGNVGRLHQALADRLRGGSS